MTEVELAGKVALVTGSVRRVGKSIALALAAEGMHLVLHHGSSSDADAHATLDEVQQFGGHCMVVRANLRQPAEIAAMFERIRSEFGRLDVLVNSASVFAKGAIADISLDEWQQALDVNLTAPFVCSQHAARLMNAQPDGGCIINILDLSAFAPWRMFPHHSVSKAGLKMLTDVLALSLGPQIRVNAIAPGPVLRDEGNSEAQWARIGARLPLRRTGDPDDVAQAVVFLASQRFITGTTIMVDGGEHLLRTE
jgi:NAD(P)-dependent dehydrogenase (short-subunit alcohol dehydrogenase family)